jgi:2-dehydro-3-deoxy-D-gluconate 5-dehydrogenase
MSVIVEEKEKNVFDLGGKTAIITGGAMGIGFGIAKRYADAGANVLIADLNANVAFSAAKKLVGSRGKADAIQVDVGSNNAGEAVVRKCTDLFGSVDILVNDAGIYPISPVLQMTPEFFDRIYNVNLKGLVFVSKAAALKMVEQKRGGKIIHISSIDAFHPSSVGLAAYDTTKGGVTMFTKSLALELAPHGIAVNSIAPGGIATEGTSKPLTGMSPEQTEQMMKGFMARIPFGRMGVPDDIAKVAVFLASSASDYMTGQTLIVDGGMLLS